MAELNLAEYTASGIYTIEVDGTQMISYPLNSGRIVIGTSRTGPINSLVLNRDSKTAQYVYGTRDLYLENRGSYFHKALDIMLGIGPVYSLNLVPIDLSSPSIDNLDQGNFLIFSAESALHNAGESYADLGIEPIMFKQSAYKDFYNRQKFWSASEERLNSTKNSVLGETATSFGTIAAANNIVGFANLSKRELTIFVVKANVNGYDATIFEWYNGLGEDVVKPEYLHKDDFVSDFFVDVIVIEGDWSDNVRLSKDVKYSRYFNNSGLEYSNIDEFIQLKDVKLITRQTGSLIADFQDRSGNAVSIDKVFNRMFPITECIMSLDESKLEAMLLNTDTFEADDITTQRLDLIGHGATEIDTGAGTGAGEYADDSTTNKIIDLLSYRKPLISKLYFKATTGTTTSESIEFTTAGTPAAVAEITAYEDSKLYKAIMSGFIYNGMTSIDDSGASPADPVTYIKVNGPYTTDIGSPAVSVSYFTITAYSDSTLLTLSEFNSWNDGDDVVTFVDDADDNYTQVISMTSFDSWTYTQPNVVQIEMVTADLENDDNALILNYLTPGHYVKAKSTSGRIRMLKILSVSKNLTKTTLLKTFYDITVMTAQGTEILGIDMGTSGSETLTVYKGIQKFITDIRGFNIDPFILREQVLPNGSAIRQKVILDYIFDSGLYKALTQSDAVEIRQIVDSYEGTIEPSTKYNLVKLAATHQRTAVFANDPSMKQFEESVDPSFIDSSNGLVDPQHIVDGGNLLLNPSFTFTLPEESLNGIPMESFAYFVMPYLMIRDKGKNKRMIPAPYMANAYYRKFQGGSKYAIVAGTKGKITEPEVIGPEYDFDDDARKIIEPKGHNLIVKRKRHGIMLLSNNTAYYKVESALNSAHVRENLISIENDIDAILFGFLFDFNDPITRIRVKTQLENYLDGVKSSRGITYYEVTIDESNNTEELISKNMALVDIKVSFNKGIHKFINRIILTQSNGEISPLQTGFAIN